MPNQMKLKRLPLLLLLFLNSSSGEAQVSNSTHIIIEEGKRFFTSQVVDQTYVGKKVSNDSIVIQVAFQTDSLKLKENGGPWISYSYNPRFGRDDHFTIEVFESEEQTLYLYCYFVETKNTSQFYALPDRRKILTYSKESIRKKGFLCARKE